MDGLSLNARQRCRLQLEFRRAEEAAVCRRILAILEVDAGQPISGVAELLGVSRQCIYNWIENYAARHDPEDLAERERPGRPPRWTDEVRRVVQECVKWPPDSWGYQAVSWSVPLLQNWLVGQTGLTFSHSAIRQHLHRLGYTWKRSRYVLEPDPDREKKKADLPQNPALFAANCPAV
jgi:transposase